MLPDQEPQTGAGMFAPFFGTPAYSMVLLARMATKSKAPVIFVWCERLSWGRGYHLHFREMPDITNADSLKAAVQATNNAVEHCVRRCSEQYQWSYRRFRTRPDGEETLYCIPACASTTRIDGLLRALEENRHLFRGLQVALVRCSSNATLKHSTRCTLITQ